MFLILFFFKQKTAYEMRISDWSSDVCSSDLQTPRPSVLTMPLQWHQTCFYMWAGFPLQATERPMSEALAHMLERVLDVNAKNGWGEYRAEPLLQDKAIGRASCRDRVCQYW